MAKIFAKKYQQMIDDKEITLEEALELVEKEVPTKWVEDVKKLLHE